MGKWIFEKVKIYMNCFMDIVFPRPANCTGCGRELKEYSKYRLCPGCFQKINMYNNEVPDNIRYEVKELAFDSTIVSCYYEGLARDMVHKLKYNDRREIAVTIAAIMGDTIKDACNLYDYIVPVPISKQKLKKRGYNHVHIISSELSEYIRIPVINCLNRIRDTDPQVLFNIHDRWYNVKDCFICNTNIEGKRILLVDDIITTGATAHFCSEELKKSGASNVTVFSFAKSN